MATRRKYKTQTVDADPVAAPGPPAASQAASSEIGEQSPLQAALHAQGRAEELQRQSVQHQATPPADPQQQLAAHIDGLPISKFKKDFLRQHPQVLFEPLSGMMRRHHQAALDANVPDDTEDMSRAILEGLQLDIQHHGQLTAANARPTPQNAEARELAGEIVEELHREAESHLADWTAEQPAPSIPAPRRSIPMSAPVSREVPMASGGRASSQNTLSLDERQIAAISFPHLSIAQAEYEYFKNKKRMHAMKASGAIQGDR